MMMLLIDDRYLMEPEMAQALGIQHESTLWRGLIVAFSYATRLWSIGTEYVPYSKVRLQSTRVCVAIGVANKTPTTRQPLAEHCV